MRMVFKESRPVALVLAALALSMLCHRGGSASGGPTRLTEAECFGLMGGQAIPNILGCPLHNCKCNNNVQCSSTAPANVNWGNCSNLLTANCQSNNGSTTSCWQLVTTAQQTCSIPDNNSPNGCATTTNNNLACGKVWQIGKSPMDTCGTVTATCTDGVATACGAYATTCKAN